MLQSSHVRRPLLVLATAAALLAGSERAPAQPTESAHGCGKPRAVSFRAADGTRLHGHRYGRGRTAVVFAHQSDGDACEWAPYARRLASLGYLALAFDFRNNGASQRRSGRAAIRYAADVAAAARTARRLGATKVFAAGGSIGGAAALIAGVNIRPRLAGVISLSAPRYVPLLDALATVPRLRLPVLYLAGSFDPVAEDSRDLFAATGSADKTFELLPYGDHGAYLLRRQRARQLVEAFLRSR